MIMILMLSMMISGQVDNSTDIVKADRIDPNTAGHFIVFAGNQTGHGIGSNSSPLIIPLNSNEAGKESVPMTSLLVETPATNDVDVMIGSIKDNGIHLVNPAAAAPSNISSPANSSAPITAPPRSTSRMNPSARPSLGKVNVSTPLNASSSTVPDLSNESLANTSAAVIPPMNLTEMIQSGKPSSVLGADQRLLWNQTLASRNRQYALRLTDQCNVEIVRVRDEAPIWSLNSKSDQTPCSLSLRRNGVLTLLDRNLHQIWRSDSNEGAQPVTLRIDDTGNLTISDMLLFSLWKTDRDWRRDHMNGGESTMDRTPLVAANRMFTLELNDTCQLSIKKRGTRLPVWGTPLPTNNSTNCRLSLNRLGVVSLISNLSSVAWSNNYTVGIGDEPFQLKLLSNGTLVVTSSQIPVWAANEHGISSLI